MNKYLTLLSDRDLLLRLGILAVLLVMFFGLSQGIATQSKTLKALRQEQELVMKIKPMKEKIKGVQSNISRAGLKVEGVVYQNGSAYALINSTIYSIGDVAGEYKVVDIGKNTLKLLNLSTQEEENFIFQEVQEDINSISQKQ
jgi:hypothetical protein